MTTSQAETEEAELIIQDLAPDIHCRNAGCPGHCPICQDPVDYCTGHSQAETRRYALSLLER